MERLKFFVCFVCLFILVCHATSQNDVQNTIEKDNDNGGQSSRSKKSRTIYDYQTRVVAYKDLIESKCLLEVLNGGESLISTKISDANQNNRESVSKLFITSNELSKRQIWRLAGQRITEFCRGFPTYLIKDTAVDDQNIDVNYMLNDLPIVDGFTTKRRKRHLNNFPAGRVRGQTQSQYLSFGQGGEPGKAEAESSYNGTKAVVTGSSGMGQAQSQSSPFGCDECFGPGFQDQTLQYGGGRFGSRLPSAESRYTDRGDNGQIPGEYGRPGGAYPQQPNTEGDQFPGRPGYTPEVGQRTDQFQPGRQGHGEAAGTPGRNGYIPGVGQRVDQLQPGVQGSARGRDQISGFPGIPSGQGHIPGIGQHDGHIQPGAQVPVGQIPGGTSFPEGQYQQIPGQLGAETGNYPQGPARYIPGTGQAETPVGTGGQGQFSQGAAGPGGTIPGGQFSQRPGEGIPSGSQFPLGPEGQVHGSGRLPPSPVGPGGSVPGGQFTQRPGEQITGGREQYPQGPASQLPGRGPFYQRPDGGLSGGAQYYPQGPGGQITHSPGGQIPGGAQIAQGPSGTGPIGPGSTGQIPAGVQYPPASQFPSRGPFFQGPGELSQRPGGGQYYPQGPGRQITQAPGGQIPGGAQIAQSPSGTGPIGPGSTGQIPGGVQQPQGPGGRYFPQGPGPFDIRFPQGTGGAQIAQRPGDFLGVSPGSGKFGGDLSGNYQSHSGQSGKFYGTFQGQYESTGAYGPGGAQHPGFGGNFGTPGGPGYTGPAIPGIGVQGGYDSTGLGLDPGRYGPSVSGNTGTGTQIPGALYPGQYVAPQSSYPGQGGIYTSQVPYGNNVPGSAPGISGGVPGIGGGIPGTGGSVYGIGEGVPGIGGGVPGFGGGAPGNGGGAPGIGGGAPGIGGGVLGIGGGAPGFGGGSAGFGGSAPGIGPGAPGAHWQGSGNSGAAPGNYGGQGVSSGQGPGYQQIPGGVGGGASTGTQESGGQPGTGYVGSGGIPTTYGVGTGTSPYGNIGTSPGFGHTPGGVPGASPGYGGAGPGGSSGSQISYGPGYGGSGSPGQIISHGVGGGLGTGGGGVPGTGTSTSTGVGAGSGVPGYAGNGGTGGNTYGIGVGTDNGGPGYAGNSGTGGGIYGTGLGTGSGAPGYADNSGRGGGIYGSGAGYPGYGGTGQGPISGQTPQQYVHGRPSDTGLYDQQQGSDESDSQVQTSVQQNDNETHASAQAQGSFAGGTADSQVSGTYSGSGSFSASAGSNDAKRGVLTQVNGGKDAVSSSAQGRGGLGQSQAQVVLSSETGNTLSSAQTSGLNHGTQTQVQASEKGGVADAQANGPGSTSSQAQIGFAPYNENDSNDQEEPFKGGGTAAAQSGTHSGMTQTQIQGKFSYGIRYTGAAQAGSGSNFRNFTEGKGLFKPINFTINATKNVGKQSQSQKVALSNTPTTSTQIRKTTTSTLPAPDPLNTAASGNKNIITAQEEATNIPTPDDDPGEYGDDNDYEPEYDEVEEEKTEKPTKRNLITQTSNNQRQHIILDPLEDFDATIHQSKGDFLEHGTVLQPGQHIPGSEGYRIPAGFRGKVQSIANGRNTYAIGKNSQAQSVTLSPGSGKIIYKSPVYALTSNTYRNGRIVYGGGYSYQEPVQPVRYGLKSGKVLPNFVSVVKSESGSKDLETGRKVPSVTYTQSSTCGVFTNSCIFAGGKKVCYPKPKTNPDGSLMVC